MTSIGAGRRIAVIATGGLSRRLPFPDWRAPRGDDDEFLADSFRHGRGRWQDYEVRRRQIVVDAPADINEEFDNQSLSMVKEGRVREFPELFADASLVRLAGNGVNEVRSWLTMAAALEYSPGQILCYSPMPEWLTGMAVAVLEPGQGRS